MAAANIVPTSDPGTLAYTITTSDAADLTDWIRGLYVGGAGNVKVTTTGGSTVTFTGVPAGTVLPVCCKKIFATGTTATSMVGIR